VKTQLTNLAFMTGNLYTCSCNDKIYYLLYKLAMVSPHEYHFPLNQTKEKVLPKIQFDIGTK